MVAARTAKWMENEALDRQRQGRRDLAANLQQGQEFLHFGPSTWGKQSCLRAGCQAGFTLLQICSKVRPGDLAKRREACSTSRPDL